LPIDITIPRHSPSAIDLETTKKTIEQSPFLFIVNCNS